MSEIEVDFFNDPSYDQRRQVFINLTRPDEAQKKQTKKTVRSHAARVSAPRFARLSEDYAPPKTAKKRKNQTYLIQMRQTVIDDDTVSELPTRSTSAGSSASRSPRSELLTPLAGSTALIPASQSPLYTKPYVPMVLNNYLEYLAVPIPEIDENSEVALLRTVWLPMILHSPAIFSVIILFSASHFLARNPTQSTIHEPTILYLKQCALRSINLLASARTCSDETIAAVAKMASYEAIFGEDVAYQIHMGGVKTMIDARGGLLSLGLNGFLARLLLFIDTNSAHLLHTHLFLQGSSLPRRIPFQAPNLKRFIGAPISEV